MRPSTRPRPPHRLDEGHRGTFCVSRRSPSRWQVIRVSVHRLRVTLLGLPAGGLRRPSRLPRPATRPAVPEGRALPARPRGLRHRPPWTWRPPTPPSNPCAPPPEPTTTVVRPERAAAAAALDTLTTPGPAAGPVDVVPARLHVAHTARAALDGVQPR